MPRLRNPTSIRLFATRLQRHLGAREVVRITEEEARDLENGPVFEVERLSREGAPTEEQRRALERQAAEGRAKHPSPQRAVATRGDKRAEVTRGPRREKRG